MRKTLDFFFRYGKMIRKCRLAFEFPLEERKNLQTPDLTFTYESKIYIEGPKTKFTHFDEYDKALLHQFGSIIKIVKMS